MESDTLGYGPWAPVQTRAANPVNEIIGISETAGPSWTTPAYDAAGNMTTVPQPNEPTESYAANYDAWNRLIKLMDGSDLVQENQYDARNFRITRKDYSAGVLAETRHFYYTSGWQCLEERLGSSPDSAPADRQQIWGLRYIDDLILRDRFHSSHASSSSSSGSPTERLYALQDGNWNVIALADALRTIQERFAYTAYGVPLFLDASFIPQPASASEWETLYAGYRYDQATGLYPVRYRFLHPVLGTWISRDPMRSGANLYESTMSNSINFIDPLGTVVIFVHGVGTSGVNVSKDFQSAVIIGRHKKGESDRIYRQPHINFNWAGLGEDGENNPILNASDTIGLRPPRLYDWRRQATKFGMSHQQWLAADTLRKQVTRLRHIMDSNCGLKHEPINVIAHSQGTVIVTAALQDGMKVDNVIFLGSPMDREEVENQSNNINFRTAAKNVKGSLWNYYSYGDWVAFLKGGVGTVGLPSNMTHPTLNRVYNVYAGNVGHTGGGGWWDGRWIISARNWNNQEVQRPLGVTMTTTQNCSCLTDNVAFSRLKEEMEAHFDFRNYRRKTPQGFEFDIRRGPPPHFTLPKDLQGFVW